MRNFVSTVFLFLCVLVVTSASVVLSDYLGLIADVPQPTKPINESVAMATYRFHGIASGYDVTETIPASVVPAPTIRKESAPNPLLPGWFDVLRRKAGFGACGSGPA